MPKIHYLTKEDERKIIDDYVDGRSIAWLISAHHCGPKKIINILNENNRQLRTKEEQVKMGFIWKKKTTFERYGVESIWQSVEFLDKRKQTCLEKYGVEYPTQLQETINKQKETNKQRYGVEHPIQCETIKNKIKQTNIKKYGYENPMQSEEIVSKVVHTKNNYTEEQKQEIIDKMKKTCSKHYGVEYYMQTLEYHKKARKHYFYEDEIFDSFPELAFYLYHKLNNIDIERCVTKFNYTYNDEDHYYFPDFAVDNVLYEIKGNQFLKEDGSWQCPFDHSLDGLYEAKHQCALDNNVIILYNKEYRKYLKWFRENNYNKEDFLIKEKINYE